MTKADTRTALMDAAEQAVRARGHDGFSYADLSEAIGIRKASIHYHFPAKSDLLTAIMERYRDRMSAHLADIDRAHDSASERLAAYLDVYRVALQNCTTTCLCVAFCVGQDGLSDETRTEIGRFRAMVTDWLEATFRLGAEDKSVHSPSVPDEEAAALYSLAEGAQIAARFEGKMARFDAAIAQFMRRLEKAG
ncbi:TetR/AcrR family transcriptional regulator [Hoeflea prorocentri]|uniref:TetR/AcrR family transcriptional regulator n=1 Tax=Hoeflea prorocentri TaxID=1922333 RepID=A0A9X3UIF6_9HYPH|nr:TetR/AcrR family transcriptional regulator [Hoeflea prorocentri]MCY6379789.1 TetR/AcrR family transcriptional regulator [Hoeflea prorocentri]MDA5397589.1 TetR/AcrR family transcriptional regulator [Hoeflea prorocentri]